MKSLILWSLLVIPWLSLIFLRRSIIRRYMPVALFVTVINTLVYQSAYFYRWWRELGLFGWDDIVPVPWIYSAYLVATIWVFRFTYGKFWRYLIVNLILDGSYIFRWYPIQIKLGMANANMPSYITYIIMISVSLVIYVYQMWQEGDILK